jgi:hypothetical protein
MGPAMYSRRWAVCFGSSTLLEEAQVLFDLVEEEARRRAVACIQLAAQQPEPNPRDLEPVAHQPAEGCEHGRRYRREGRLRRIAEGDPRG